MRMKQADEIIQEGRMAVEVAGVIVSRGKTSRRTECAGGGVVETIVGQRR